MPATPTQSGVSTPTEREPLPPPATPPPGSPLTLRIWAPPQFDLSQDTPAARLLRARLDEFTKERPRVQIDVRIKALQGPGGLLDALTTSKAAAPEAAPDLIALPRDLLETAALKGLLIPFSPSSYTDIQDDWYDYARELAQLQDSVYGLPFAGDALALAYNTAVWPLPPSTWADTLQSPGGLIFHADDAQALFTLTLYQSRGGAVRDEQSKPVINSIILTEVLTYYVQAKNTGVIPVDITQLQNDEQVWTAFVDTGAPGAVIWISQFLDEAAASPVGDLRLAPLPTSNGQPHTLANGWVWSLSSHDAERQRIAVELAQFLTDKAFLAEWTESAGYLPPYPDALENWDDARLRTALDRIARSAHILPPGAILAALSGPLWQATTAVLTGQSDPVTAAQQAASSLTAP